MNVIAEFPMRKLIVGMMALAVTAMFLTSFFAGANMPGEQSSRTRGGMSEDMAAVPELMAKIKNNPKDEQAVLELAELFTRAKDWQNAVHFWTKALDLTPGNLGGRYHRGVALVQLKRFDEAVADFEGILQTSPDAAHAAYYLGMINKYEYKNTEAARKYLQQVLNLNLSDKEFAAEIKKELAELK